MVKERLSYLIERYVENTATTQEVSELLEWYRQENEQEISWPIRSLKEIDDLRSNLLAEIEHSIDGSINKSTAPTFRKMWSKIAVAASLLIFVTVGGYFLLKPNDNSNKIATTGNFKQLEVIEPGSNRAILTLSDGKQVALSDAPIGNIAQQGNIVIDHTAGGILYSAAKNAPANQMGVHINSVETPRGGQYHLKLSDGTGVWLNAASSIRYPVVFSGKDRIVEITGEVYFEVKHNASQPFRVKAAGQIIEDLGTAFDVNIYPDEPEMRTTLIKGKVKITNGTHSKMLQPGSQAITIVGKPDIVVRDIDPDKVLAWRNGQIYLGEASIQEVMRQIGRWYNVDVVYSGLIRQKKFNGMIDRNVPLSDILQVLNHYGLHCQLEERKIVVTAN